MMDGVARRRCHYTAIETRAMQAVIGLAWLFSLNQHSTMCTAKPPRAVSLYLVFMSAPVSRMVLIT
jgi:hypothetical protein